MTICQGCGHEFDTEWAQTHGVHVHVSEGYWTCSEECAELVIGRVLQRHNGEISVQVPNLSLHVLYDGEDICLATENFDLQIQEDDLQPNIVRDFGLRRAATAMIEQACMNYAKILPNSKPEEE